jgi:hypothetical protein
MIPWGRVGPQWGYRIAGYFGGDIILAYFGDFHKFTKIKIAKFVMYIMFYNNGI